MKGKHLKWKNPVLSLILAVAMVVTIIVPAAAELADPQPQAEEAAAVVAEQPEEAAALQEVATEPVPEVNAGEEIAESAAEVPSGAEPAFTEEAAEEVPADQPAVEVPADQPAAEVPSEAEPSYTAETAEEAFWAEDAAAENAETASMPHYPAMTLTAYAGDVLVTLAAPEGCFPEGTQLIAYPVGQEYIDAVENTLEAQGRHLTDAVAVDVTPVDQWGNEVQPMTDVSVSFSGAGLNIEETDSVEVFCVSDDAASVAEVSGGGNADTQVFTTDHFTIYVAGGSARDPNGDGSNQPNSSTHSYVLEYGNAVLLESDHGRYLSSWSVINGNGHVSLSNRVVTNINSTNQDQPVRIQHTYRDQRRDPERNEWFYITAKATRFDVKFMFKDKNATRFEELTDYTTKVIRGGSVTDIPSYSDDGDYVFHGWYEDEACTREAVFTNVQSDKTYYGKYDKTVTLTYNKHSGHDAATVPEPVTVAAGSTVHLSGDAYYEGHALIGWGTEPDGGTVYDVGDDIVLDDNMTLYAQWEEGKIWLRFWSNFNSSDNVLFFEEEVEENADVVLPDGYPARENYVFLGWSTSRDGDPAYYPGGTLHTGTGIINLYAIWGPLTDGMVIQKYLTANGKEVYYNGQEQSISDVREGDYDRTGRRYGSQGYIRVGDATGTNIHHIYAYFLDIKASGTNAGHYSTPMAAPLHTHNSSTGGFPPLNEYIPVNNHELIIKPVELTVSTEGGSKDYDGEALTAGGKVSIFDGESTTTVDFSHDGDLITLVNGEKLFIKTTGSQTDPGSSRNEYEVYWETESGTTANIHNYVIKDGTIGTLVVNSPQVHVDFDLNGGGDASSADYAQQIFDKGGMATKPATDPTKEGCTFKGWYTEGATEPFDFTTPVNDNILLEARWSVTVTFDPDGGTGDYPDQVLDEGATATKPVTDPTKEGYIFKGWYQDDHEYDFSAPVTHNTDLKAKWAETVKVTIHASSRDGDDFAEPLEFETEKGKTYQQALAAYQAEHGNIGNYFNAITGYTSYAGWQMNKSMSEATSESDAFNSRVQNNYVLEEDTDVYYPMIKDLQGTITVTSPECGTVVSGGTPGAEITVADTEKWYASKVQTNWCQGANQPQNFSGTIIGGDKCYAYIILNTTWGYRGGNTSSITVNGGTFVRNWSTGSRYGFIIMVEAKHVEDEAVEENIDNPTCTEDGSFDEVIYCKNHENCGKEISREKKTIPALGHDPADPVEENRVEPTCTEDGSYDEVVYCKRCGAEISREAKPIPALGHDPADPVEENRVEPTCTEDGSYDEVVYCKRCGAEISREAKPIPALGHDPADPVEENRVEPTCTEDGSYDMVVYCNRCGEELSRETTVIPALGHQWGEWTVTKEPTYTEDGEEQRVCARCGAIETRAIKKLDPPPAEITYLNTSGNGNIWVKGSGATSDFTFKRSVDDSVTFEHFAGISVDGVPVDASNYTAESGSVVIKLLPAYLETLSLGDHTLTAHFNDGNSADAAFKIIPREDKVTPDKHGNKAPKTGDKNSAMLWIGILSATMVLFVGAVVLRRRKHR